MKNKQQRMCEIAIIAIVILTVIKEVFT